MSQVDLADRKDASPGPVRRIPMTVRLSQPLLVQLMDYLKTQINPGEYAGLGGLLFGNFSAGQLTLERFRAFALKNAPVDMMSGIGRERALNECLTATKGEAEFSGLKVMGWFAVRGHESRGLNAVDIEFHNRRFRRVSDVALLLLLDQHANVRTDFYSKSPYAPFSQLRHRYGTLRLSLREAITEPVEIRMTSNAQRAAQPVVLARMPGVGYDPGTPRISYTTGPVLIRTAKSGSGENRLFTMLRSLTSVERLIVGAAASFVLAAGFTFITAFARTSGQQQLPDKFPPGPALGMQVQPEGDNLLLTWNGRLAGNYKAEGVMLIDDATRHREVRLDRDEVSSGALLYRPASNDVLFRLRLSDANGKTLTDSLRRVDATRAHSDLAANQGNSLPPPAVPPPNATRKAGSRMHRNTPSSNKPASVPKLRVMSVPAAVTTAPVEHIAREMPRQEATPVEIASLNPPESIYLGRRVNAAPLPKVQLSGDTPALEMDPKEATAQFQAPAPLGSPNFAPLPDAPRNPESDVPQHPRKRGVTPYVVAQLQTKVMPDAKILAYAVQSDVTLQLEIGIDEKGRVTNARVVKSSPGVNAEIEGVSIAAVKQWTFQPAQSYGSDVASNYMVFLHFSPAPR